MVRRGQEVILITIKQLREYRYVKTNIRLLEQELDELILKSSRHDGAGGGKGKSDTVAQIVQEREKTRKRIQLLIAQKNAVDVYISECEPYYGLLLRRHYVEGKTWTAVAAAIGGGNTGESVKKACHRYIYGNP